MTIAAAYLVSDGVVFGADSSTTVQVPTPQGPSGVVQLLTHSQKVFEVGENSRFGVSTWGAGNIGPHSHRTIIARLAEKINDKSTVEAAAKELRNIVLPEVKKFNIDFVGYYLGGWNPGNHEPACFRIEINKGADTILPLGLGQCFFSGNPVFFSRVFFGFDPQLRDLLKSELKQMLSASSDVSNFEAIYKTAFDKVTQPLVTAGFQDLPIREAIDFLYTYIHITIKAEKFKFGPPTCGGPIEVGFISTDRTFRWVKHKPFYSAIEEEEGGDDNA